MMFYEDQQVNPDRDQDGFTGSAWQLVRSCGSRADLTGSATPPTLL